ncbi:hypothetical protein [uncultured Lacinutrix sp.]|uniref:hypothetical protein n=1 Tax=uncultured Lacinutrix sp. TaxID=574032 RepID=UPI00262DDF30|nr:hypothetical protein [uncultured Lacinutrix sp.]
MKKRTNVHELINLRSGLYASVHKSELFSEEYETLYNVDVKLSHKLLLGDGMCISHGYNFSVAERFSLFPSVLPNQRDMTKEQWKEKYHFNRWSMHLQDYWESTKTREKIDVHKLINIRSGMITVEQQNLDTGEFDRIDYIDTKLSHNLLNDSFCSRHLYKIPLFLNGFYYIDLDERNINKEKWKKLNHKHRAHLRSIMDEDYF